MRHTDKTYRLTTKRKPSSQRWLMRHLNDPFVHQATRQGYRCRSALKLLEIQKKFALLGPGMRALDLGCAPGGWSQVLRAHQNPQDLLVGIDLLPVDPLEGLTFVQGDILEASTTGALVGHTFDGIFSDMAPSLTGHTPTDRLQMEGLLEMVWHIAHHHLREGGHLVAKVYHTPLLKEWQQHFAKTTLFKPESSRAESREIYWIGQGWRGSRNGKHSADKNSPTQ